MTKLRMAALAAMLAAGISAPAFAADPNMGGQTGDPMQGGSQMQHETLQPTGTHGVNTQGMTMPHQRWVRLGRSAFSNTNMNQSIMAGRSGRGLSSIALQAVNNDARCSALRVHFTNGTSKTMRLGHLEGDRLHRINLPGGRHNVSRVSLSCHPVGRQPVMINVLGI